MLLLPTTFFINEIHCTSHECLPGPVQSFYIQSTCKQYCRATRLESISITCARMPELGQNVALKHCGGSVKVPDILLHHAAVSVQ